MYSGVNATRKPTNQHQNAYFPSRSFSLKPVIFGNQYVRPANIPNNAPPTIIVWKCATRNKLLCNWKSAGGTASITPAIPPKVNVLIKPKNQYIGDVNLIFPLYIV